MLSRPHGREQEKTIISRATLEEANCRIEKMAFQINFVSICSDASRPDRFCWRQNLCIILVLSVICFPFLQLDERCFLYVRGGISRLL